MHHADAVCAEDRFGRFEYIILAFKDEDGGDLVPIIIIITHTFVQVPVHIRAHVICNSHNYYARDG